MRWSTAVPVSLAALSLGGLVAQWANQSESVVRLDLYVVQARLALPLEAGCVVSTADRMHGDPAQVLVQDHDGALIASRNITGLAGEWTASGICTWTIRFVDLPNSDSYRLTLISQTTRRSTAVAQVRGETAVANIAAELLPTK